MINKINLSNITKFVDGVEAFVCCASFENRSTKIAENLSTQALRRVLICYHHEYKNESSVNLIKLESYFNSIAFEKTELSIEDPIKSADSLVCAFKEINDQNIRSIAIDITTFTRETLLILLRILFETKQNYDRLLLLYNPASEMSETWLSRGIRGVRGILGFPGKMVPSKPLHLVIIAGFELERANSVIIDTEPDLISIGRGSLEGSICHEFSERNKILVKNLSSFYGDTLSTFSCSVNNPYDTIYDIKKYLEKFSNEYNTVITGLNTKISSIGIGLYAIQNDEIQLCYPPVNEYNIESYSSPSEECIIIEVDWNKLL